MDSHTCQPTQVVLIYNVKNVIETSIAHRRFTANFKVTVMINRQYKSVIVTAQYSWRISEHMISFIITNRLVKILSLRKK